VERPTIFVTLLLASASAVGCYWETVGPSQQVTPSPTPTPLNLPALADATPVPAGSVGEWVYSGVGRMPQGWRVADVEQTAVERLGGDTDPIAEPKLRVSCMRGVTSVFVDWGQPFLTYEENLIEFQDVELQVDDQPSSTSAWYVVGPFTTSPPDDVSFRDYFFGGSTLSLRTEAFGKELTIKFELDGAQQAFHNVRYSCHW
jgi:hypothetical protein